MFAFFAVMGAFYFAYQFVEPALPKQLTISTGREDGAYYRIAQNYAQALEKHGITLHVKASAGSVENLESLQQLDSGIDLAFVQGGTATGIKNTNLLGLASIYYEPLWLFLPQGQSLEFIHQLKGKRIAVGAEGSGTRSVTQTLLEANELFDDEYTAVTLSGGEATQALLKGEVDALFSVSALDSPNIVQMLHDERIQPLSLRRAQAYARRFPFLSPVILYEGTVALEQNIPAQDLSLVAPAATLVAKESMHPALVSLIMQVATETHGEGSELSPPGTFPSSRWLEFEQHDEASRYIENGPPFLQRFMPFWAATLIDRLKVMLLPLIALVLPLSRLLPPTYRWRMRRRVYQWYDEVKMIDTAAHDAHSPFTLQDCLTALDEIEEEIRQVDVPLSFHSELYTLRQHTELMRQRILSLSPAAGDVPNDLAR
ncbi:MAG: TAXI family TRAP transporter solute-binding subunit [Granulosicoccaceae bacterium]